MSALLDMETPLRDANLAGTLLVDLLMDLCADGTEPAIYLSRRLHEHITDALAQFEKALEESRRAKEGAQ